MSMTATFTDGVLAVAGDALDNKLAVSRTLAGTLYLNGGTIPIGGGPATVATTTLIQVFGQDGNDSVTLSEANGVLPSGQLFGGAGNDALTGGSGNDQLFGQVGNDTLRGLGGDDFLFGGLDNDLLIGGTGHDELYGEAGDDRLVWNAADGSDLFEGGDGFDTGEVNGGLDAEVFTVTANGTRVRIDRIGPTPSFIDAGTMEKLQFALGGGDDQFFATGNLATLVQMTVDGGAGNDVLNGGNGADLLIGGDGNDTIDGNQGNDTLLMGTGNDRFAWSPGDGSDIIEGGSGADVMQVDGSAIYEQFVLSANGARLRMTRDIASVVFDADDVETVELRPFGGADLITVDPLAATDVRDVRIDLALFSGGGDAAADLVAVKGTDAADLVSFGFAGGIATVLGLATRVHVGGAEAALDGLQLLLRDGDDLLDGTGLGAGAARLVADGGLGNDRLTGSANGDTLLGGAGNDELNAAQGDDLVDGGEGDDRLLWKTGDGNDVFDGGAGLDVARVGGSAGAEKFSVTANGERVRVDRLEPTPTGSIDLGTTEQLLVELNGGDDQFFATGNLATLVQLTVDGGLGNDVLNGGNGADLLIGGDGNDTIDGNQGNDRILMGAGNDRFSWDPGDGNDVIEGGADLDTLQFNGSAIGEQLVLSAAGADGARLRLTRDIAGITLDADDIEAVELRTVGGSDRITVGHLGGTDVKTVRIDLAPTLGGSGGDGVADTVLIDGSAGNDAVAILMENGALVVRGLGYDVVVRNFEPALDRLQFNGLGGDDTVQASPAVPLPLLLDGGDGNDVLTGGAGDDWLDGGAGFDTLTGGAGNDVLLNGEVLITGLPGGVEPVLAG